MANRSMSLIPVWLTLGLIVAGIWTDVLGYSMRLIPLGSVDNTSALFLVGRLLVGVFFLLLATKIPKAISALMGSTALIMSAATGAMIIAHHQTLLDPTILASGGAFFGGAGYAFIVWPFYFVFAEKVQIEHCVVAITVSLVFETVLSILISLYLPSGLQMMLVMVAPLVCALFYFLAKRSSVDERSVMPLQKRTHGFEKHSYVIEVLIFSAALVFIRALSTVGIWGKTRSNFTGMAELSIPELLVMSAMVLLMAYLVFILPRNRLSLSLRCVIGFAVMLAGLQILAVSTDFQFGYVFDSITTAIELFAHLVCWMIAIECLHATDIPYFQLAGMRNILYGTLALVWTLYLANLEFATSTFVMVIVYVLLLAVMLIVVRNHLISGSSFWSQPAGKDETSFLVFARSKNLTPREAEIFSLLMSGSKRTEIEQECSLSEGTVKTHISNIYKKLDVHSKKDLMDLFEMSLKEEPREDEPVPSASHQS